MKPLEYGQYCGSVRRQLAASGALVSAVSYDPRTFNGLLHYHDHAHLGMVIRGGCREKKKAIYELAPGSVCYYHAGEPHQMRLVADFLEEHWDRQITLAELSAIAGLHPVTICKYFSGYFGCTLGEHLRKLKISYALQLLPSDLSLTEVAYCCGFFDQSHFTRTFKGGGF